MKARSVIFTHIQWPFAVFGLPPKLMGLCITMAVMVFGLTIVLGAAPLSFFALGITMAVTLSFAYGLARKDHHVESVFLTALAFWKLSSRRWLLAGASSPRSGSKP